MYDAENRAHAANIQSTQTEVVQFKNKFAFRPEMSLHVGVEREFFVTDKNNVIVPEAGLVLAALQNPLPDMGSYSYELSACQVESQSLPTTSMSELRIKQQALDAELRHVCHSLGLRCASIEVAPSNMPLSVYRDPKGRYDALAKNMPAHVLLAACQVTGTHVHVGMPDPETALRVYNEVVPFHQELCEMGDGSDGKRLQAYGVVKEDFRPPQFTSWEQMSEHAIAEGFYENPRDCWYMIRLTMHGTIEFRNFGVTDELDKVVQWAAYCQDLCRRFIECC